MIATSGRCLYWQRHEELVKTQVFCGMQLASMKPFFGAKKCKNDQHIFHDPRQCTTRFCATMPDGQIVRKIKDFRHLFGRTERGFFQCSEFSLTPMLAFLQSALASDGKNVTEPQWRGTGIKARWKVSGLSFQLSHFELEHGKVCHERQRTQVVQDMRDVLTDRSAPRAWHKM
jgi:hypothetical protein